MQAIENAALDPPPVPGKHSAVGRDHEYIRHGTLSLLAGIDLLSGEVLGLVRKRHRSAEFIEFLKLADAHYPAGARIRLVLDNHSAHISKQTRAFLGTLPNRFAFTFTPKHGSWLNLIESFFGKMAKTLLRGIRVASADELKTRIELYLKEVNETPVVHKPVAAFHDARLRIAEIVLLLVARLRLADFVGRLALSGGPVSRPLLQGFPSLPNLRQPRLTALQLLGQLPARLRGPVAGVLFRWKYKLETRSLV